MRVKVSKYWWAQFYFMIVLAMIIVVGTMLMIGSFEPQDRLLVLCGPIGWLFGIIYAILMPPKVFYAIIEINGNVMCSSLFGRNNCKVYMDQTVYYAVFVGTEAMFRKKTFIAVSNETFFLERGKNEGTFIGSYDKTKQIICPLDTKMKDMLPLETWICVEQ